MRLACRTKNAGFFASFRAVYPQFPRDIHMFATGFPRISGNTMQRTTKPIRQGNAYTRAADVA
jgi:hypothetical protein